MTFGGHSFGSAPFGAQADTPLPLNPVGVVGASQVGVIVPSITVALNGVSAVATAGALQGVGSQPVTFNFMSGPAYGPPAYNTANFNFTGSYSPPAYNAANFSFSTSGYASYTAPGGHAVVFNFGSALTIITRRRYVTAILV